MQVNVTWGSTTHRCISVFFPFVHVAEMFDGTFHRRWLTAVGRGALACGSGSALAFVLASRGLIFLFLVLHRRSSSPTVGRSTKSGSLSWMHGRRLRKSRLSWWRGLVNTWPGCETHEKESNVEGVVCHGHGISDSIGNSLVDGGLLRGGQQAAWEGERWTEGMRTVLYVVWPYQI